MDFEDALPAKVVKPLPKRDKDQAKAAAMALSEQFGRELRAARIKAGLSQQALGAMTGIGQAHVSEIELGRVNVTLETMLLLAHAARLNVSLQLDPQD
jgi:ribosome-binding protein aMBF1 (putative translation factor)